MRTFVLIAALVVGMTPLAGAQTPSVAPTATPVAADLARPHIDALLASGHADAAWFSAAFLGQISVARLESFVSTFRMGLGDYKRVDGADGDYTAHFANGTDEIVVQLDADNLISGITFKPAKLDRRVGVDAMHRLAFLKGSWKCTLNGGGAKGIVQDARYSFSPDGLWMTEYSPDSDPKRNDWATQMWGYDANASRLVAYQFAASGVYTKSVYGWIGGVFKAQRDENGAMVSLKSTGPRTMQWSVVSADRSFSVHEDCVRQ